MAKSILTGSMLKNYKTNAGLFTKTIASALSLLTFAGVALGKSVDANTAQTVAYNFMKGKAAVQAPADMTLAYTGTMDANGTIVTDLYIYNWTSGQGFVIVSADDNVTPVLGYSTEINFFPAHMSPEVTYWLNKYENQITCAIQNNISANKAAMWSALEGTGTQNGARTTSTTTVSPLLHTLWDQSNPSPSDTTLLYNADCPYDASQGAMTVTGCVATAMSQIMQYWKWPDTGVGSNTYTQRPNHDGLPSQTANFAVPFYFDSMQTPHVTVANRFVASLMYMTGVSVNMHYGTPNEDGSGSYVTSAMSPITNCAEYALKTYFRYPGEIGYQRANYSNSDWVDSMVTQMALGLPVIYAGSGPQGGHCWVMDGFESDSFFHFNWGWSGYSDGYYTINNLIPRPAYDTFNANEEAILRIIPDTPSRHTAGVAQTQVKEDNITIFPNPASTEVNVAFAGTNVQNIMVIDISGRMLQSIAIANGAQKAALSVNELPNGMYLMRLQTNEGTLTRKFVIAR